MVDQVRKGRSLHGGRALFFIHTPDGVREMGYGGGVEAEDMIIFEEAVVLGKMKVQEHIPVGYHVTRFTCQRIRLLSDGLTGDSGEGALPAIFPRHGNNDAEFLNNLLAQDEIFCTLQDVSTGIVFATLEDVKVAGRALNVVPRRLVLEDISFVAVAIKDETES